MAGEQSDAATTRVGGIDVGKTVHHACVVDENGKVCWSQNVANEPRSVAFDYSRRA
jgi:Transposase